MKAEIMNLTTYFPQLDEFQESDLFSGVENPWEVLLKIEGYLIEKIEALRKSYGSVKVPGAEVVHRTHRFSESMLVVNNLIEISSLTVVEGAGIVLSGGTVLEPGALIKAPALIGEENEIRQGAYLRGSVITGKHCTVGHSTEIKNSVFMNHTEAGHFAYVGDSICGSHVNLGAGTKLANLQLRRAKDKIDQTFPPITLKLGGERVVTTMPKIGAIVGDHCETGCNAVTAPGVFLGHSCWVFANTTVIKGYYPPRSVI